MAYDVWSLSNVVRVIGFVAVGAEALGRSSDDRGMKCCFGQGDRI